MSTAFSHLVAVACTLEPPPGEHLISMSVVAVNGNVYGRICTGDQVGFVHWADLDGQDMPGAGQAA